MLTIMITGAAGFVGSHVTREAGRHGAALTVMTHHRPPSESASAPSSAGPVRVVRADLADPRSLRGVCEGIDVLLHCASRIGGTAEDNEAVNARGTAALVAEARRAGVSRIVYLGTASVYGRGTYHRARPERLTRRPSSPTSRTRAAAEDTVLDAGGIVLRPHLVYGRGDRWVVPGLVRLLNALPGGVPDWNARMSVVSAAELATLLVGVARAPATNLTASVYHASHPRPVTAAALLAAVARCAGLPPTRGGPTVDEARALMAGDAYATKAIDMLATSHWFDCAPLWTDLRMVPGPGFEEEFPATGEWYRELVRAA